MCLVGAGLGNAILASLLRRRRPDLSVTIFEAQSQIPRARTWSFHQSDIQPSVADEIANLIARRWTGHEVVFPNRRRRYNSVYATMTPEKIEVELRRSGVEIQFNSAVEALAPNQVVLADGREFAFECVVDGRGYRGTQARLGYQKFVGQTFRLKNRHGLSCPVLMDATVEQIDGYRFFYLLPWSEDELLVEDTRYSASPDLDVESVKKEIYDYVNRRGWEPVETLSIETGVLPIPLDGDRPVPSAVPAIGMAGGFFHPVTGYSLPDAVRLADRISALPTISSAAVNETIARYRGEQQSRKIFYHLLNRMLFLAAKDDERWRVFEHFYSLPEASVQRFYAGRTNVFDGVRILSGRPPVPVVPAIRSMLAWPNGEAR